MLPGSEILSGETERIAGWIGSYSERGRSEGMEIGKATPDTENKGTFTRRVWGSLSRFREGTLILTIITICIIMSFLSPYFLTADNLRTTILSFAINGIVVIGMTIVMVNGGIDLSVGSVMAVIGAIAGKLYQAGVTIWIAALIALIIGGLLGIFNGFFITRVGLSPFITTLAMLSIARGAAFVVTQGIPLSLYSMPNGFKSIGIFAFITNLPKFMLGTSMFPLR